MGKLINALYDILINVSKRTNLRQIVLFSFLLKIFMVIIFSNINPVSDHAWYYQQARNISLFNGIISPNGTPTAYWPAGYPLILGLIFYIFTSAVIVGQLFNAIISTISTIIFFYICLRVTKNHYISLGCSLLLAFYPDYLAHVCLISPEPLFIFLVLLSILLFLKFDNYWISILSGLFFGLATMVRPQAIFIPFLLLIAKFRPKIKKKSQILIYGVFFLTLFVSLIPWTIRNYYAFNKLIFISNNGGVNLFIGNNPNADGKYSDHFGEYLSNYTGLDKKTINNLNEIGLDSLSRKAALDYISSNPVRILYLVPLKLKGLFAHVSGFTWISFCLAIKNTVQTVIINTGFIFENIYYYGILFLWILTWLYLVFIKKKILFPEIENKLPIIIISYFVFIYGVVFFGSLRFNLILIPFIILSLAQKLILIKDIKGNHV